VSEHSTKEQVTAFTGLLQSASVAHRISMFGIVDNFDLITGIKSVLCTSPKRTIDVYGSYSNLLHGQKILDAILQKNSKALKSNVLKYSLAMYITAKKLINNPVISKQVTSGLNKIKLSYNCDDVLDPLLIESLNKLYLNTISKIKPRIIVSGDAKYLKDDQLSYKVRCALFSGIRSAILWYQCGGRLWHLIFCKSRINNALEQCKKAS
jgi:high frequency lysogenization protein